MLEKRFGAKYFVQSTVHTDVRVRACACACVCLFVCCSTGTKENIKLLYV